MQLSNDDYKGTDPAAAISDFKSRVAKYEGAPIIATKPQL